MQPGSPGQPCTPPKLRVTAPSPEGPCVYIFDRPFVIGRLDECDVSVKDDYVSRRHADVTFYEGQWWIRDLASANGIFWNGERVTTAPLTQTTAIRLGIGGPFLEFGVELLVPPPPPPPPADPVPPQDPNPRGDSMLVSHYVERYFSSKPDTHEVGEHTMMVRRAFQQVQSRHRRRYIWIIGTLLLIVAGIAGVALVQRRELLAQRNTAKDLFYGMKALDVDISSLEKVVLASGNRQAIDQVNKYRSRRQDMQQNYDKFLSSLHIYDRRMPEPERLTLRVARIFGECELNMPPAFAGEVRNYIGKWQSSGRYARAVAKANQEGYTRIIAGELLKQDLPPQFFYLALQESDFDAYASGPPTYKGIAKGMWQFIPETAMKYGLKLGPLIDMRRPDPADERHRWDRETQAAALYLKDLYSTDAQASGLLVMASYNWGENKVIPLIRSLPANPRERNFWKLLTEHRQQIPQETYDYVFYIVAAAVIGENPRAFGFDFDNPLGYLEAH